MSEELKKPSVVDFDLLLQPISEEAPSGEDVRYSGVYDEIREARRADDNLDRGDWKTEIKVADYRKVVSLATETLATKSKDLQITAWLSESLVKLHGWAGLRDSLTLLARLQSNFWETLYPEIDEGDMESRGNAIAWVDAQVSLAIKDIPITPHSAYSFNSWEESKRYDIPENVDNLDAVERERVTELRQRAEAEGRITGELWRKEKSLTRRSAVEAVNFAIEECWAQLAELNRVIEEKFDRNQMPGLSEFQKTLDQVHTQVKMLLAEKREEEPDEIDFSSEGESQTDGAAAAAGPAGSVSGAIQGRRDALKRLNEIADFFKKTEPHSPVSYLVQRAVKWGDMPLENWLRDVIKDQSVLDQLTETLGVSQDGFDG